jgi:Ni/Co efflux regulator RcnB
LAQNRLNRNRAAPNRQGRNRAAPNRRNNQQGAGRFGGNRNNTFNGRRGRNGAVRGPGRNGYAGNRNLGNRYAGNRYAGRGQYRNRGYNNNQRFNGRRNGGRQYYYSGNYRPSIRVRPYRYPRGHYYTSWQIGAYLPSLFLSTQYYYDDYYQLGLAPPPRGYRWVRYGTDVLLVNLYSGEAVDVVYSAFYW